MIKSWEFLYCKNLIAGSQLFYREIQSAMLYSILVKRKKHVQQRKVHGESAGSIPAAVEGSLSLEAEHRFHKRALFEAR